MSWKTRTVPVLGGLHSHAGKIDGGSVPVLATLVNQAPEMAEKLNLIFPDPLPFGSHRGTAVSPKRRGCFTKDLSGVPK